MMRFSLLPLLAFASVAVGAPLDPLSKEPYRWVILLRTPRHPLLDASYRENLAREIRATLQPGLGLLGTVEVIDLASARVNDDFAKDFQAKGWAAFDSAAPKPIDNIKWHGLSIELRDGTFALTAQQYDGFTGLVAPLRRVRIVRSLEQIPRAVGLMLEPDFAPVGTVEVIPTDAAHRWLVFRGHECAPLTSYVRVGDIFMVSVIKDAMTDRTRTLSGAPVPYTLLKVVEPLKQGRCKCLILSRWVSPFGRDERRSAAIRAIRLSTVTAPVRVQLVDRNGKPHNRGAMLSVSASDVDFSARSPENDGFDWRDGVYRSRRPFANVACISVGIGDTRPQQFPVALLNDDLITLVFDIDPVQERRASFLRDCNDLRARIAELLMAQKSQADAMNQLLDTSRNREALARAETGRDAVAAAEKALVEELKQLQNQPGATDSAAKDVLESCAATLAVVRASQAQLLSTITSLKEAIAKASSPENLEKEFYGQKLVERIQAHLQRGDVPEALEVYEKLIDLFPSVASYKDEREKLKAEWVPKDDAHRAARECIRTLTAAKTPEQFKAACVVLKKSIPIMKSRNDRLGLRKLHNTFNPAIAAVQELISVGEGQSVNKSDSLDQLKILDEILVDLRQCEMLTRTALRELAAGEKK